MKRNTMSYKAKQFLMFAGPAALLFCAVVVLPFVYGLYLTFTSWDGISKTKPFVGFANYIAAFKDVAYWQALGRTFIYSAIAVILVNVVAFLLAYLVTSGIKGQNFFRAGFFIPNLIGGIVLGYVWKFVFNRALVSIGQSLSIFHILAGNAQWSHALSDHRFRMAVCRLHDADLCGWVHERTKEPYGSSTD